MLVHWTFCVLNAFYC